MKHIKKVVTLLLAFAMVLAMSAVSFAQTEGTAAHNTGSITIKDPAKGETYKVHKLFDATVTSDGKIAYKATSIPEGLTDFFEIKSGYVYPKASIAIKDPEDNTKIIGTQMTDDLKDALESWASDSNKTAEAVSDGSELTFQGLPYGYYVMTTSHKSDPVGQDQAKAAISVTSTKPNATINDKNVNQPSAKKEADKDSYSVGDTVTYTATFDAPNYMESTATGAKEGDSEQVVSYTIKDTLPDFLANPTVTKVEVKQPGVATNVVISPTPSFGTTKSFDVKWVTDTTVPNETHKYTSAYKAGSQIIVTYTATLTKKAKVGAANENKVSIMPNVDRGDEDGPEPYQETDQWNDTETITTHAAALQKTDGTNNLAGAKFKFKGLTLSGAGGVYTVVSYDPNGAAGSGTEVECDADGKLVIIGIDKNITLVGTETKAPEGYNKLNGTFNLETIEMGSTTTTTWGSRTVYYDADGNVVNEEVTGGSKTTTDPSDYSDVNTIPANKIVEVVNEQGVELPSTGGIGTVIFYVLGALLVVGCGIVLISKRRMNSTK